MSEWFLLLPAGSVIITAIKMTHIVNIISRLVKQHTEFELKLINALVLQRHKPGIGISKNAANSLQLRFGFSFLFPISIKLMV